jgi:DNA-binding MarR family transcriptional regulator
VGVVDSPSRLRSLPSWLTSQVALQGDRLVSEALAEAGVRKHHFTVLTALAEAGAVSQAELGRRLWLDRSDLHAVLNDLEREGLVARVRDEADRRRNLVRLTADGVDELARWDARVEAAQDELLAPLTANERRELVALLERVVAHHRA